ncbi:MAG TPA: carboxylesterase/lipase family protein [Steroidobacteraceae bacterium]|nr:carboxylesterase/lipase family protein [Steroidobacteraceae bacterium]
MKTGFRVRGTLIAATLAACPLSFGVTSKGTGGIVVMTTAGPVRGDSEGGVRVFRGIRFAEPPIGSLRFHAPVEPKPWTEVRPALDFAPACPQVVTIDPTENGNSVQSEDCLAVNVWTPAADARKRPVMVYIHGGAFIEGSARNTGYDGAVLAERGDLVVVSLQYRLGPFGFLELSEIAGPDYAGSGNNGIRDQIAALHWVQDNVARFGGDPANVTICGESVGATSVGILLAIPGARGLFQRAILESNSAARVGHDLQQARKLARQFLSIAGAGGLDDLQKLSTVQLRNAEERLFNTVFGDSSFGPTWDGLVIPASPMKMIQEGRGASVPVLLGTNRDEIRYWSTIEELPLESKPPSLLQAQVAAIVGPRAGALIDTYRRADPGYGDAVIHLETDLLFRMTSIRMAEAISARQPTYMYLFTYRSTSPVARYESAHSMELPFVFGLIDELDAIDFIGRSAHRERLMGQMQQAWIQFVRTGDPNHAGLPHWPPYDRSSRATMEFGVESKVVLDPLPAQRAAWAGIPFDGVTPSVAQVAVFLTNNGTAE